MVIRLSAPAFSEITVGNQRLSAGGGAKLGQVISTSVREGLAGLETLVGIPGTSAVPCTATRAAVAAISANGLAAPR